MQNEKAQQKVSEWLLDLGTHEIYDAFSISQDFINCTGIKKIPWLGDEQSAEFFSKAIDARGLGGVKPTSDKPLVDTTTIAEACYRDYGNDEPYASKMGRGSHIHELIGAIKRAGN